MKPLPVIENEFDQLSQGGFARSQAQATAAVAPVNAGKNRYCNILALDDTRVCLQQFARVGLDSDYVNANHIVLGDAADALPRYLATQAPLPDTVAAFWLMVWEQGASLILMLTRLIEKDTRKASVYWPEEGHEFVFGPLRVRCVADNLGAPLRRRRFAVAFDGAGERVVEHVYYMAWPDFGLPEANGGLLDLLDIVDAVDPAPDQPVVVHCSAGVGRSGTFIGIHALFVRMRRARSDAGLSVPECILQMRRSRVGMVQTKEQYALIYRVLWELRARLAAAGAPGTAAAAAGLASDEQDDDDALGADSDDDGPLCGPRGGLLKRSSDSSLLGAGSKRRVSYLSRSALLPSNYSRVGASAGGRRSEGGGGAGGRQCTATASLADMQSAVMAGGGTRSLRFRGRAGARGLAQSQHIFTVGHDGRGGGGLRGSAPSEPLTSSSSTSAMCTDESSACEMAEFDGPADGPGLPLFAVGE